MPFKQDRAGRLQPDSGRRGERGEAQRGQEMPRLCSLCGPLRLCGPQRASEPGYLNGIATNPLAYRGEGMGRGADDEGFDVSQ